MDDQPWLDLVSKHLFQNVKRRQLSEAQKERLLRVTEEIQSFLDALSKIEVESEATEVEESAVKPRRRLVLRRNK